MPTKHALSVPDDVASRRRHLLVLSLAAVVVAGLAVAFAPWLLGDGGRGGPPALPTAAGPPPYRQQIPPEPSARTTPDRESRWLRILTAIDLRREAAWRRGEPELLRSVYVSPSPELREDRRLMAGYLRRGLRVSGVGLRFLRVEAQRVSPDSASLLVVDRLGAAFAVDDRGAAQPLPRDLPTRHRVELEKVGRQWRISRVELAPEG